MAARAASLALRAQSRVVHPLRAAFVTRFSKSPAWVVPAAKPLRGALAAAQSRHSSLPRRASFVGLCARLLSGSAVAGSPGSMATLTCGVAPNAAASTAGLVGQVEEKMDAVQQRLMFEDECILVDENDVVIGHDNKYNCHLMSNIEAQGLLHRAFSVFLFDSHHRLLLQQRAGSKVTFPLVWTNTCCSHPLYRPSELTEANALGVREAARRKLEDELGIDPRGVDVGAFTCLGRIHYKAPSTHKWGEHEIDYLLVLVADLPLHPNPNEVAAVRYVDRQQLRELLAQADTPGSGVSLSPWFRLVVDRFLFAWWDHLDAGTLPQLIDMDTIHRL